MFSSALVLGVLLLTAAAVNTMASVITTNGARTVLVTGANKGIGLAICQGLVARPEGFHVLMGCRNVEAGKVSFGQSSPLAHTNTHTLLQVSECSVLCCHVVGDPRR
jgi:NAD(P)-dependent dehydrogenase (short-subunit alcohol dehydrogenase family)